MYHSIEEAAKWLRYFTIRRYNLSEPQIRMLESGIQYGGRGCVNVAWGLANRGLIKRERTSAGERYLGFSGEGEDVAGALRFTVRILKEG